MPTLPSYYEPGDFLPEKQTATHSTLFLVLVASFLTPGTIALCLRVFVRVFWTKTFALDDVLLVLAQIINIVGPVLWWPINRQNNELLNEDEFYAMASELWTALAFYVLSAVLVKIAIALFFARAATRRWQQWFVWTPLVGCVLFISAGFASFIFRCGVPINPVRILLSGKCALSEPRTLRLLLLVMAAMNAVCDCAFAIVPLYMLVTARGMPSSAYYTTMALSFLAVLGAASSIIRTPWFAREAWGVGFIQRGAVAYVLCIIETEFGILTISLATLKPLIKALRRPSFPTVVSAIQPEIIVHDADVEPSAADWSYAAPLTRMQKAKKKFNRLGVLPSTIQGTLKTITMATQNRDVDEMGDMRSWKYQQRAPQRSLRITRVMTIDEVLHRGSESTIDEDFKPLKVIEEPHGEEEGEQRDEDREKPGRA